MVIVAISCYHFPPPQDIIVVDVVAIAIYYVIFILLKVRDEINVPLEIQSKPELLGVRNRSTVLFLSLVCHPVQIHQNLADVIFLASSVGRCWSKFRTSVALRLASLFSISILRW